MTVRLVGSAYPLAEESIAYPRKMSLRLVLLVAFILTVVSYIISYGFYLLFIHSINPLNPGSSDLTQLYDILDSAVVFVFNPVVAFVIFYKLTALLSFESNSDYIDMARYAFVGGFLGYIIGYFTEIEMASLAFGPNFRFPAVLGLIPLGNLGLGALEVGLRMTFLAFTAIVIAHLRSSRLMATGVGPEAEEPQPDAQPPQNQNGNA
jgi:hypothetical protein